MKFFVILGMLGALTAQAGGKQVLFGDKVSVGAGYARSYLELNDADELVALGMAFSEGALERLPHHDASFLLPLPKGTNIPFQHVTMDWNPHGHEPDHVYTVPHFDFHFYLLSHEARKQISCQGEDTAVCLKKPADGLIPPGYVPAPTGVPQMGWHWVDPTSHEFHGKPFSATFIYGYYNGELAFIEPMITLDFLKARTRHARPFARPAIDPGFSLNSWSVGFDRGLYRVELRTF